MQHFWITAELDDTTTVARCFVVPDRETAVQKMLSYLELEFGVTTAASN